MSGGGVQPHEKGRQTRHMMSSLGAMQRGKALDDPSPASNGKASYAGPERMQARQARPARKARPAR